MKEIKQDIIFAWNEAEELMTSLIDLNDFDLINNRESLITRASNIVNILGKHFDEKDLDL